MTTTVYRTLGSAGGMAGAVVAPAGAPAGIQALAVASGGAVCDGTNDEAEINAALVSYGTVWLYGGSGLGFVTAAGIALPAGAQLRGFGPTQPKITASVGASAGAIKVKTPGSACRQCLVENLYLLDGGGSGYGIDGRGLSYSRIVGCRIEAFDRGVWLGGDNPAYTEGWSNRVADCYLYLNDTGIYVKGKDGSNVPWGNANIVEGGVIWPSSLSGAIGIDVVDGAHNKVIGTDIGYANGADGIWLRALASEFSTYGARFEFVAQAASRHPIQIASGSLYHAFFGNGYTNGCLAPYVNDANATPYWDEVAPTYNGGGTVNPYWTTHNVVDLHGITRIAKPTNYQTANYTITLDDDMILADATAGAFTVTLPSAASAKNREFTVKKYDSSANAVTVGGTVDGTASRTLTTQHQTMTVRSDGGSWRRSVVP